MLPKNWAFGLRASVAAFALMSMFSVTAEAQLSGINLGVDGSWSSGDENWGTQATVLVPLVNSPAGMFYTMASGDWQYHNPAGSIGFGYRQFYAGGGGWGVYGTGDLQQSRYNHRFYGTTAGLEVFIPNGLSVSTNVYVPLGKKTKVANGTGNPGTVVLKDKTTGGPCNPADPVQVCKLVIDGSQADTIEHNRLGVDLTLAYEVKVGGVSVTPFVTGYVFDRENTTGLGGVIAGADVNVPLTNAIALKGGVKIRYDKEQKTDVILGLGVNIQLGTAGSQLTTAMQRPPRRLQDHSRIEQERGQVLFDEPVIWNRNTSNSPVSEVRFVNAANQAQAAVIVAATAKDGIVVFNGNITAPNASLNIANDHVGLISGSTILGLKGARTGLSNTFKMVGTKGTITQNNAVAVITAINRDNVILENLTISKGFVGVFLDGVPNSRLINLDITGTQDYGVETNSVNDSIFDHLKITNAGAEGIRVIDSHRIELNSLNVINSNSGGIHLDTVTDAKILNTTVNKTIMGSGIILESSENVLVDRFMVTDTPINERGIDVATSKNITISNGTINNTLTGISIDASDEVHLTNLVIQRNAVAMNTIGVRTVAASKITFTNVDVQKFALGYLLPTGVTVMDGGFNKASGNTANCDATPNDATGSIKINMGAETCN